MNPSLYIIAGPNGAGKTTFAREFLPNYADCKNFINADLIAQGVSPFAPEAVAFRAGRLMIEEISLYAKRGESFGATSCSTIGYSVILGCYSTTQGQHPLSLPLRSRVASV